MQKTDALEAYSVAVLRCADRFLLLQRSPEKQFAPGKWTGIGGHVEPDEYDRLRSAALREVQEEAGLPPGEIRNFVLRRAVLVSRPLQPFRVILYFTGLLDRRVTPACPEGTLDWKTEADFDRLDIIETTRPILHLLAADMQRDPDGLELPVTGVALFDQEGVFQTELWTE